MSDLRIEFHRNDLPGGLDLGRAVAVDTETMGLNLARDRLCLVQVSAGDGICHLVQIPAGTPGSVHPAPNLVAMLNDAGVTKIFHYARFDVAALYRYLGVATAPIYCTKIASKLTRTFTDRHGLKDLCRDLLGIEVSKQQQSSDWGAAELTPEQMRYAASDVAHLHALREKLDAMLARLERAELARSCFEFVPTRVALDLAGWPEEDIFQH